MRFETELIILITIGLFTAKGVLDTIYEIKGSIEQKKKLEQKKKIRRIKKQSRERVLQQHDNRTHSSKIIVFHEEIKVMCAGGVK